ncbi:hypothetical protein B7463_g9286, partial [Scytalidium lignicola]
MQVSSRVKTLQDLEKQFTVGGFNALPYFFERANGSLLWDVDGKEYIDFICMFSAVNTGHNHPYILEKVTQQLNKITMVNFAAHTPMFGRFAQRLCNRFGYDKVAALTSGTEADDNSCKIARRWGINQKGIGAEECIILGVGAGYHGLGMGVWGLMDPSPKRTAYGLDSKIMMNINPTTGELLEYLDIEKMRVCLEQHKNVVAAVIMECIHGATPDVNEEIRYARAIYDLCKSLNILFIADEVRQGCGKTGKFFSFQHLGNDVKPDIVTIGKSITGGFYPQSFIMGTDHVMKWIGSHEIACTYGYTPLAIAAASAGLDILDDERLLYRATQLGELWRETVKSWNHSLVDDVSGIGADSNLILRGVEGYRVGALCMHKGLFLYPRVDRLRISFALTMSDELLLKGCAILKSALDELL